MYNITYDIQRHVYTITYILYVYTYKSLFQILTKTDHIPLPFLEQGQSLFLTPIREMKVISKCPTIGLCLFCFCQLTSASAESLDPPSCQNPLPSAARGTSSHELYCSTEM